MIVDGIEIKIHPVFTNYAVSRCGKVYSKPRKDTLGRKQGNIWLKPSYDIFGYPKFSLCLRNKRNTRTGHRLVLETYVGSCPVSMEACHNNGNRADNRLENLRWDTRSNNHLDAVWHGTHISKHQNGESNPACRLTAEQVQVIFHAYHDGYYTQQELANHFGVGRRHINDIINKKTWKHLWETITV